MSGSMLLLTLVGAALAWWLLRQARLPLARWWRHQRDGERVQVEDALKHVYECEYHQRSCSWQTLSGVLGLSSGRALSLLERLVALGLVVSSADDGACRLTPNGRRDALRVIRIHRLWERYLAEETGVAATDWHTVADRREHRTTWEEAQALASQMGHPRYDPHGDPIPTADGEMPPPLGQPLSQLAPGTWAEIVHVEDEPPAVYAQLLAQGLQVGMRVRVFESSAERIRFEVGGEEQVLAPIIAANLAVQALPGDAGGSPQLALSLLGPGEQGRVRGISPLCVGVARRRFFDLGFVPGTLIGVEMRSRHGDPTAYRIRGALIALRREQAELIQVEREAEAVAT
ncbi:MAG: DtxR family transcriptional regulator [Proteobacteria bacterium]|nr:DtxR family transcriptional regulator [Pseudomonadota bacterium]